MNELLHETTPKFLLRRTGLNDSTLAKRLRHKDCPKWEATKTDARGRVWRLRLSQATLEFLLRPLDESKQTRGQTL